MGAAENYHVGAFFKQRLEAGADSLFCLRTACDSVLYQFDESLSYVFDYADIFGPLSSGVDVFGGFECACCGKDSDHSCLCRLGCRLDGRLHAYELDRIFCAESCDCGSCGGIACHDYDLAAFAYEEVGDLPRSVDDVLPALFPIWAVGIVGIIDITLLREHLADLPED